MSIEMFVDRLGTHGDRLAILTDRGEKRTYLELAYDVNRLAAELAGPPRLIIIEANNTLGCLTAYLACLRAKHPVVLVEPGSTMKDGRISRTFAASEVFHQSEQGGWRFDPLVHSSPAKLHPDLCILLSTSGTTGSPKLVRLSRSNIESNASAITCYLSITQDDRAITSLPPFYSFGMSVLNSHLYAGATLLLTDESVASDKFWHFFEKECATTFSAVPFTFDVLERIGFRTRSYPSLRYIAQAGGRLQEERVVEYAKWGSSVGKQFFVMYGQTEAGPRMAYVPPDHLFDNPECIGTPIPGGAFQLLDEYGARILQSDQPGELVFSGPNVMMGYAESEADLSSGMLLTELHTGDLACRKSNSLYYIVGRKSRFSKILGLRISLDEIESWLHQRNLSGIVSGDDRIVVVAVTQINVRDSLKQAIIEHFGLPASAIHVLEIDTIPTLSSGKYDYKAVLRAAHEATDHELQNCPQTLIESYRKVLGMADVRSTDSFLELGGDSVSFVEISLVLEDYLGYLPENWETMSIASLESLAQVKQHKNGLTSTPTPTQVVPGQAKLRQFWLTAVLGLSLLIMGEAVLQLRAYLNTDRSTIEILTDENENNWVTNTETGIKTYRKNAVVYNWAGRRIETNSLGFRGPEIGRDLLPEELRIIVAGASSVVGFYAETNADTFSSLLEQKLRQNVTGRPVNVVNAGVPGYTLKEMERLIDHVLIGLQPAVIIIYPGFNDMFTKSCLSKNTMNGFPVATIPNWTITREIISKNTNILREQPVWANAINPKETFPSDYVPTLNRIVTKLSDAKIELVLVTSARAYKNVDPVKRVKLAKLAHEFLHSPQCFSLDGLLEAGKLYNDAIRSVAMQRRVPLIDLASAMPGGLEYFHDDSHFTSKGQNFSADFIYRAITNDSSLSQRLGLSPVNN
jgi:acyl-CoA synthetase (AMP-forming)/AMP-acid ligase II/lysophospholipase L1-like esterase